MKRNFMWAVLVALLQLCSIATNAQQNTSNYDPSTYRTKPVWIDMMNDTGANYYETIEAFRVFWKDRVLPREANEDPETDSFEREVGPAKDGESEREREREKRHQLKNKGKEPDYTSEVRAFKGWMQYAKQWLKEDGTILSPAEQQQLINKQREELNQIEKNQKKN